MILVLAIGATVQVIVLLMNRPALSGGLHAAQAVVMWALLLSTPAVLHPEHFEAAVQARKHVYCEKPLSYDVREGRAMVEAVRRSGRIVQIGFQRRQSAGLGNEIDIERLAHLLQLGNKVGVADAVAESQTGQAVDLGKGAHHHQVGEAAAQLERALEAGGVDYVTKPIVPEELIARIRVHLANARMTHSARAALDVFGRFLLAANRAGRILWCTPQAAKRLREGFKGLERLLRSLKDEVAAASVEPTGEVTFGIPPSPRALLGVSLIERFAKAYPRVIIRVTEEKGCDLILMASHGKRGVQALLLGIGFLLLVGISAAGQVGDRRGARTALLLLQALEIFPGRRVKRLRVGAVSLAQSQHVSQVRSMEFTLRIHAATCCASALCRSGPAGLPSLCRCRLSRWRRRSI